MSCRCCVRASTQACWGSASPRCTTSTAPTSSCRRTSPATGPEGNPPSSGNAAGTDRHAPFVPHRVSRTTAFWSIAVLLVLVLAASGVPSPLYCVYQERFAYSSGVLSTVVAVYAFALLAELLVFGSVSDHATPRPVLVGPLLVET